MIDHSESVVRHYSAANLTQKIAAIMSSMLPDDRPLTVKDLASLDQFHTRGIAATIDLARLAEVNQHTRVLDAGCGLGGPARYLAATYDCTVLGVDLSPDFIDAAKYLSERSGLIGRTDFRVGDALNLPANGGAYDLVWMQHVAMNIADRDRLYREVHRVLQPGGRLALFDVVARDGQIYFPVPWSRTPETSFLLSSAQTRYALATVGFKVLEWHDDTDLAKAWFRELAASLPTPGGPSLGVAMGADFPDLIRNLGRNLAEGRVGTLSAVLERAA